MAKTVQTDGWEERLLHRLPEPARDGLRGGGTGPCVRLGRGAQCATEPGGGASPPPGSVGPAM